MDTTTWKVHVKARRKTDYSHSKQCWQHEDQQNDNHQKTKIEKKNQLYGHFKWLISNISHEKTWTWRRKGNCKPETESLLIAALNNAIKTNHIKARTDKTQQNSKCRLCRDRDETINHIISKFSKLAQYKTRHDWVGKVIHWELWKKLEVDHRNKRFLYFPTSVLENDTHKLLWNFDIQTDHLISVRWPNLT